MSAPAIDTLKEAADLARHDLDRLEKLRGDLQAMWEWQATEIVAERLSSEDGEKVEFGDMLRLLSKAADAFFSTLIDAAEEAKSAAYSALEEAEWDAAELGRAA